MLSFVIFCLSSISLQFTSGYLGDYFVSAQGQFPFFAYCNITRVGKSTILRQGTLISPKHIIMNANYLYGSTLGPTTCILGAQTLFTPEPFQQKFEIPSGNVKIHDHFRPSTDHMNNIALIELPEFVYMNEYVRPASLPQQKGAMVEKEVFGVTRDLDVGIVVYAKLPVLETKKCSDIWYDFDESNLCIPSWESNHFFVRTPNKTWVLIGMKLFRADPAVWTNALDPSMGLHLAYYLDWIIGHTRPAGEDYYDYT